MRILIPVAGFHRGGGNRVLSELATNWISLGHEVQFISTCYSNPVYFPTTAKIVWVAKNGKPVETNVIKPRSFLDPLTEQFMLLKGLNNKAKAGEKWDVILANHSSTAYPVCYSKLQGLKCYYIQAYEPEFYNETGILKNKLIAIIAKRTYGLNLFKIVNAPVYYKFKEICSNRYVPPGIDLSLFYCKPPQLINLNRKIKLGCIGRIEPNKGTSFVLEAFNILQQQQFDCELYIAFGKASDKFAHLKNIVYVTPANDEELASFYRACDIVIAPPTIQFGAAHYPVLEAMAVGTPIITTFFLPCNESNSWMVSPESAEDIALMVKRIQVNEELAREKAVRARKDVFQFDWAIVSKKMIGFFEQEL